MKVINTGIPILCFIVMMSAVAGAKTEEPQTVTDAQRAIQDAKTYFESKLKNYPSGPQFGMSLTLNNVDWQDRVVDNERNFSKRMNKEPSSEQYWSSLLDNIIFQIEKNIELRKKKKRALKKRYYLRRNDISDKVYSSYYGAGVTSEELQAKMDEMAQELNPELYKRHQALPSEIEAIDEQLGLLTRMLDDLQQKHGQWQGKDYQGGSDQGGYEYVAPSFSMPSINIDIDMPGSSSKKKATAKAIVQEPEPEVEAEQTSQPEPEPEPEPKSIPEPIDLDVFVQVLEEQIDNDPQMQEDLEQYTKLKEAYQKAQENAEDQEPIVTGQFNDVLEDLFVSQDNPKQDDFQTFNEQMEDQPEDVQVKSLNRHHMKAVDTEAADTFKIGMKAMTETSDLGGKVSSALDVYGQVGEKMTETGTTVMNHLVTRSEEVHNSNFTRLKALFESQGKTPSIDTQLKFDVKGQTVAATVDHWRPVSINGEMFYLAEKFDGNPSGILVKFEKKPKWVIFSDETIEVYHTDPKKMKINEDANYTSMQNPKKIHSIKK